jgi:hypothetical protein
MNALVSGALSIGICEPLHLPIGDLRSRSANVYSVGSTLPAEWSRVYEALPLLSVDAHVPEAMERDITVIASLTDGWLGAESVRVGDAVLNRTRQAALLISRVKGLSAPDVSPNPQGTISLEWESESTVIYLEIGDSKMAGFIQIAGMAPLVLPVEDLTISFFAGLKDLLSPAKGLSISISEGYVGEPAQMAA